MSIKTMRTTLTIDDDWFAKAVNYLHCRSISFPDGHPNSPTCGHFKFLHPERGVTMV